MITEFLADALYWKYYKEGSSIRTKQNENGSWEISEWNISDGTPQPDEKEILKTLSDYKIYMNSQKNSELNKYSALKLKLNLTDDDIKTLAELINANKS